MDPLSLRPGGHGGGSTHVGSPRPGDFGTSGNPDGNLEGEEEGPRRDSEKQAGNGGGERSRGRVLKPFPTAWHGSLFLAVDCSCSGGIEFCSQPSRHPPGKAPGPSPSEFLGDSKLIHKYS